MIAIGWLTVLWLVLPGLFLTSDSDLATSLFHPVLEKSAVRHLCVPRNQAKSCLLPSDTIRQEPTKICSWAELEEARGSFISKISLNFGPFSLALASPQAQGHISCITI